MSDEPAAWITYARDNLQVARLCLANGLFNPCLQNAQQAVEKALKAICASVGVPPKRTHSIEGLRNDLTAKGVVSLLEDEECELLDSVYLPSKYPLGSVLPDFEPDAEVASKCLEIAERALERAQRDIQNGGEDEH